MSSLSTDLAAGLRRDLTAWYREQRRDLPWRRTRDPYAIWISEAMLQQTRVEAVLRHYRRFLQRFPDVRALANAHEDEVQAAWSGLGYYRRARSLHAAAVVLVERHGGVFPSRREELLALPGIGPYTAGALRSIAFEIPAAVVDGNVARVFARLFGIREELERPATQRRLWSLAEALLPPDEASCAAPGDEPSPSEWSQALMEWGALVCTPRSPRCSLCPLAAHCTALAEDAVEALPVRAAKRAKVDVELAALLVERQDHFLLVRRPAGGRMARMWELPTRELVPGGEQPALWPTVFPEPVADAVSRGEPACVFSHAITHHRIEVRVHRWEPVSSPLPDGQAAWGWYGIDDLERLALTGMARKALARVGARLTLD